MQILLRICYTKLNPYCKLEWWHEHIYKGTTSRNRMWVCYNFSSVSTHSDTNNFLIETSMTRLFVSECSMQTIMICNNFEKIRKDRVLKAQNQRGWFFLD